MAGDNVQMFILGSLTQGDAHGYQLVARAKSWGVEDWAGFGAGSIYNALRSLEKRELIVRCGTEQRGGYAPATVYGLTDLGRERLVEMLHETADGVHINDPFDIVTAFIGMLPAAERREIIKAHIAALQRRLDTVALDHERVSAHVEQGAPYDWVLATIEKGTRVGAVAIESAESLLTRSDSWGPPERLTRAADRVEQANADGAEHRHARSRSRQPESSQSTPDDPRTVA